MSAFAKAMTRGNTYTENGALSNDSTLDALVDFFYFGVRGAETAKFERLLREAYAQSPELAIVALFHLRDVRGGKGERDLARTGLRWLAENHPEKFALVCPCVPEYGRFDDWVHLYLDIDPNVKKSNVRDQLLDLVVGRLVQDLVALERIESANGTNAQKSGEIDLMSSAVLVPASVQSEKDNTEKEKTKLPKVSLLAKWLPTEGGSVDKQSANTIVELLATLLAQKLNQRHADGKAAKKGYRVMVGKLRAHLDILERRMALQEWDQVNYAHVPSRAMMIHGTPNKRGPEERREVCFVRHDAKRFREYKDEVEEAMTSGDTEKLQKLVKAKTLFPHELVHQYGSVNKVDTVIEAQWQSLKASYEEQGVLKDSLVVVDVSGSMTVNVPGTTCCAMDVAIGMGMMTSQLCQGAFHNLMITFETRPKFGMIKDAATLRDNIKKTKGFSWGGSTNFVAVFELVLKKAQEANLAVEDMPKKVVVYSDMQFDQAGGKQTNWEKVRSMYEKTKYPCPTLVFWNLVGRTQDTPAQATDKNVVLLSGFSLSLLKGLMNDEIPTPLDQVLQLLGDQRYDPIRDALRASA